MSKNRELSQFGSFVYITDETKSIGIATEATPYIGIGTGNATSKLHVVGNVNVVGVLTATTFYGDGSNLSGVNNNSIQINGTFNAAAGIPEDIDSFSIDTNNLKSLEYSLFFENGNKIQVQKVLVMNNGTTAYSQEYGIMYDPSQIVSVGATISGLTYKLTATPETGISGITTYRLLRLEI
jgi:hypothetical protein